MNCDQNCCDQNRLNHVIEKTINSKCLALILPLQEFLRISVWEPANEWSCLEKSDFRGIFEKYHGTDWLDNFYMFLKELDCLQIETNWIHKQ